MRPRSNGLAGHYIYWSVLPVAVALALSVLVVLWSTLPVQAQSESTDNDTGDDSQPTGKHIIVFDTTNTLPTDYAQRIADRGGKVENPFPETGVVVASGLSEDAAESLESDEDVQEVDPDVELQWLDPPVDEAAVDEVSVGEASAEGTSAEVETTSVAAPHTAVEYRRQWNMRTINANQAWTDGRLGSRDVTVAILDSGIDYMNKDLRGNVGGGLDRVDLENSISFVPSDDALVQTRYPDRDPITDLHYHGTHVAATVSSAANILAGVTSRVRLMGVKVLGANGSGPVSGVLKGIEHAAKNDADVINMSLGSNFNKREAPGLVAALNRHINYAHEQGAVIVVSAGNDTLNLNGDSDRYVMYCQATHVVCVSGTGPTNSSLIDPWSDTDARASYTNYGSPITVAAPGGNASLVWATCSRTSLLLESCRNPARGTDPVLGLRGTSQAAPHVSGLAALLVEKVGKDNPSEVAAQVRKSVDDLGKRGKDEYYGYGRINVAKSIQ